GQRLERRDVRDARDAVDRFPALVRAVQAIDADEEAGERLPRARGCGDQRVVTRGDRGPAVALALGGALREPPTEPLRDCRREAVDLARGRAGHRGSEDHTATLRPG